MAPRSLRKTFMGCKTGKRFLKRFTSPKGRERIFNYKFSEVKSLSNGRSERNSVWVSVQQRGMEVCLGQWFHLWKCGLVLGFQWCRKIQDRMQEASQDQWSRTSASEERFLHWPLIYTIWSAKNTSIYLPLVSTLLFSPCCDQIPVTGLPALSSMPSPLCSVWWCRVQDSKNRIYASSVSSQCQLKKYAQPK